MSLFLITALGSAAWLLVVVFFVVLCGSARRADERRRARLAQDRRILLGEITRREPNIIDLRALRLRRSAQLSAARQLSATSKAATAAGP